MTHETAVTIRQGGSSVIPGLDEVQLMLRLGGALCKTGFLPKAVNTPEKAMAIMLYGKELNIPPMMAFSKISVIQGKPTMAAELMLGIIYRDHPGAEIIFDQMDDNGCVIRARRPNERNLQTFKFSREQASALGLMGKDNYSKQLATMLQWRCVTAMARAKFPDCLSGISYTPEELGADVDPEDGSVMVDESGSPIVQEPPRAPETPSEEILDAVVEPDIQSTDKTPENGDTQVSTNQTEKKVPKFLSVPQIKRMWAIAKENGFQPHEVKTVIEKEYGLESTYDLNEKQYNELCEYLADIPNDV